MRSEIGLDFHRLVYFMQGRTGDRSCSLTAGLYDIFDTGWMLSQFRACIPDRCQLFHHTIGHEFLAIDTADCGGSAILVDLILHRLRRINLMEFVNGAKIRIAWIGPSDARRISDHGFELLADHWLGV